MQHHDIRLGTLTGWQAFVKASARSRAGRSAMLAHREARAIAFGTAGKLRVLADLLAQHAGARTLVFTDDNAMVYRVSREFLLPAITHKTAVKERHDILQRFRTGEYPVIVTSRVLNEGVDVPEASVAVVLSGTGSQREYVQRLGRILRRGEGKLALLYEVVAEATSEEQLDAAGPAPGSNRIVSSICSNLSYSLLRGRRDVLPADLLIQRYQGEAVIPKRLPCSADNLAIAAELIALFRAATGGTRADLQAQLQVLEGEETDYRMKRGLAHLLESAFSTFEMRSLIDPVTLRQRVFALSAQSVPGPQSSAATVACSGRDPRPRVGAGCQSRADTRLAVCRSARATTPHELRRADA